MALAVTLPLTLINISTPTNVLSRTQKCLNGVRKTHLYRAIKDNSDPDQAIIRDFEAGNFKPHANKGGRQMGYLSRQLSYSIDRLGEMGAMIEVAKSLPTYSELLREKRFRHFVAKAVMATDPKRIEEIDREIHTIEQDFEDFRKFSASKSKNEFSDE